MKILISNDDGIFAPGIRALVKAFSAQGHEICVCAPDAQRSAASHALTMGRRIPVRPIQMEGAVGAWAIGGTPVDCVKLGVHVLCPQAEFVISGINRGYNAGSDVLYSGTVAAAMEGVICGLPAIAVSLEQHREDLYDKAAALAVRLFERLREHPLPKGMLLNINYPACEAAKGVVAAKLKRLRYNETYVPQTGEDGVTSYMLTGVIDASMEMADDDYSWLCRGYATVTALSYDMADGEATDALMSALNLQNE